MRFCLLVLLSFYPCYSSLTTLTLEQALLSVQKDNTLDEAEKIRQSAVLYRMNKQTEEAFKLLRNSLHKSVFNEWMLEDFAAMAESLKEEKELQKCVSILNKSKEKGHKLAALLLKSLNQIKHSPEQVIENLRQYSSQNKTQESSALFLLILQKAYNAIGNNERSQYFQELIKLNFPDYYLLRKEIPVKPRQEEDLISSPKVAPQKTAIIQVGSFKKRTARLDGFKKQLNALGLDVYEEHQNDHIRIRIKTNAVKQTIDILKQQGIDFYVVQGDPYKQQASSRYQNLLNKKLSTLQVGIFSQLCGAEKQKELLEKDGFQGIQILWQEDKKLFYVFIQTDNADELLKRLNAKGHQAFIKNLEKLTV